MGILKSPVVIYIPLGAVLPIVQLCYTRMLYGVCPQADLTVQPPLATVQLQLCEGHKDVLRDSWQL